MQDILDPLRGNANNLSKLLNNVIIFRNDFFIYFSSKTLDKIFLDNKCFRRICLFDQ